jgi:uncharacterized protein
MKIWFDLSNSPHINLFEKLINELKVDHQVIITCSPLANTIDLLRLYNLDFTVIGKHYGGKFIAKIFGFPIRVFQLYKFLKKQKIDIAISQSSFHSPITSWLLKVPSIYMNDNEHAIGNIPSFIFAKKILIPEFLSIEKVKKQYAKEKKIIQYPGVKEGIYLWNAKIEPYNTDEKIIYVRPEPWIAQYYKGALNFLDDLLISLKEQYIIYLLPRGLDQSMHYKSEKFAGITILDKPLTLFKIASNCKLFIGAGGTMTREMAVIGIPTISVYQDELLDVDKYLIKEGMMAFEQNLTCDYVVNFLNSNEQKPPNDKLLKKGEETYNLIKSLILTKLNNK